MNNEVENKEQQEAIRKAAEQLSDIASLDELANLIQTNYIEFSVNKENFRVKVPTLKERLETKEARSKKFYECLSKGFKPRELLIKDLKNIGIDIIKMQQEVEKYNTEINNYRLQLAPLSEEKQRARIRELIIDSMTKRAEVGMKVETYLEECLEHQIDLFANYYLVYLILEKQDKEEWKRYFNSYDEFLACQKGELLGKATYYVTLINYGYDK